ncbi:MAG: motility protein MotR [Piscirickettsiaceae bacterium]|nr:MAG: motility protein MotR [Piscirickettsiaceae bacterium]
MELVHTNKTINASKKLKAKVITITSGKGGVGKTSTATNLALSLSALDKKVCVFDADTSLANINILLGIHPEYTLHDLLTGDKTLKQVMVDGPRGLKVIPGATGIAEYANLSIEQKDTLIKALDELQQQFDYLIIDTAAGIGADVLDFVKASQFSIVVITPEPTSLTDSFSLLKVLKRANFDRTSYILVNMALDFENSQTIYKRFESAVNKYIEVDISYLGFIQVDETVISSVSLQCPAVLLSPDCIASRCFKTLAKGLNEQLENKETESFSSFWKNQKVAEPKPTIQQAKSDTTAATKTLVKPLEFSSSAAFCTEKLADGSIDETVALALIKPLIKTYQQHYATEQFAVDSELPQTEPTSPLRDFYSFIEQEGFSKQHIKNTILTLEKVYLERHGENIRDFQNNAVLLFSQFKGEQADLKHLHEQLLNCYQRHFDTPLYDIFEDLDKAINKDTYSAEQFQQLLGKQLDTYQRRFNETFKTEVDLKLEKALLEIEKLITKAAQLEEKLALSERRQHEQSDVIKTIQNLLIANDKNE